MSVQTKSSSTRWRRWACASHTCKEELAGKPAGAHTSNSEPGKTIARATAATNVYKCCSSAARRHTEALLTHVHAAMQRPRARLADVRPARRQSSIAAGRNAHAAESVRNLRQTARAPAAPHALPCRNVRGRTRSAAAAARPPGGSNAPLQRRSGTGDVGAALTTPRAPAAHSAPPPTTPRAPAAHSAPPPTTPTPVLTSTPPPASCARTPPPSPPTSGSGRGRTWSWCR